MINNKKIAFIGVGNMASAIITAAITERNTDGISSPAALKPSDIYLCELDLTKTERFTKLGSHIAENVVDALDKCDCVFFAVKPQNMAPLLAELSKSCDYTKLCKKLYITIAAGISTEYIATALCGKNDSSNIHIVRAMPNTPMLAGMGVTALCRSTCVTDDEFNMATALFDCAGRTFTIDESDMNAIISVTSSSPAYVFKFIKAIYEGARVQGLVGDAPNDMLDIIADVLIGAAYMLKTSDRTPDELIAAVTSKGGTTERAMSELDRYNFDEAVISAMKKCTERAEELGKLS